jgi:hypothetical protein
MDLGGEVVSELGATVPTIVGEKVIIRKSV